jgi:hypothetical protein
VRHAQLEDPPQSLELRGVEESEEQRVERLVDLERDHVVDRVANDLLGHGGIMFKLASIATPINIA